MVEGPGATRNGRKVQIAVEKHLVRSSKDGDANPNDDSTTNNDATTPPIVRELIGHTLTEAFSVGKELFLIFSDRVEENLSLPQEKQELALRLHFGMNGSLSARKFNSRSGQKSHGVAPWKQNKNPTLRLHFANKNQTLKASACTECIIVEAWETTVTYPVSAASARNKLMNNSSRDVCSSVFSAQDAFSSLREAGKNMNISDALLDQIIFPGVGNIIKIESLHRSKIDPRRAVSSLSDVELRRIVRHTRQFSMDWLKSGRAGTKLVYNQTVCGTCKGMSVKMQKIGGVGDVSKNNDDRGIHNAKGHAFMSRVTFWCSICQPLVVDNTDLSLKRPSTFLGGGNCALNKENTSQNRIGASSVTSTCLKNNSTPTAPNHSRKVETCCPQHGSRSVKLCRVRNSNYQNTLRIFFTCKFKGCQYFVWADSHFPCCSCGKKTALRVSKTERSGGRWFLCCALGDKSKKGNSSDGQSPGNTGCGHFEWAKEIHLAPFASLLSPLL